MRIGLDCTLLTRDGTGISRVILELLRHLGEQAGDHHLIAFVRSDALKLPLPRKPNLEYRTIPSWGGRYSRSVWLFTMAAEAARRAGVQAWYAANYYVPYGLNVPVTVFIADLAHVVVPERFSPAKRAYYDLLLGHAARVANRILVPTAAVANQLAGRYPTAANKIGVTYHGLRSDFLQSARDFRDFGQREKTILCAGGWNSRKNVDVVIDGFSMVSSAYPGYCLAIFGPGRLHREAREALRRSSCRDRIRWLGYVSDGELYRLIRNCRVFIYPSLDEGFGLPILEAMALRTPVLCSDIPVHREVASDAAAFFNPRKAEDFVRALRLILGDQGYWRRLVEAGLQRQAVFTWEACGKTTLDAITSASLALPRRS